ncbi:MAG: polysaccharide pyruvyl transferase family protein [Enterococcus sp.]|nr:polysaccharide pyruvyl transferase family protein [Enterococcus sp.]
MKEKFKYGLFKYDTENIGDEVQSIAASRFLPSVDYFINRDNIDSAKIPPHDKVKLIMNGWYTHHPENWPPKNPSIDPLLISMHVEEDALEGSPAKAFLKPESVEFLKKNGPVGARNLATLEFLQANDIDAYFSGCLTLTLLPDPQVIKQNFALAVDVPDAVAQKLQKESSVPVISIDTVRTIDIANKSKFLLAKYWLFLYQSAQFVVTTRLHTMLPSLALGTPVLGLTNIDPKRFSGLIDLVNHMSVDEFLETGAVFDESTKNPTTFLQFKEILESKCFEFTGYDSHESYLKGLDPYSLLTNIDFISLFNQIAHASRDKDFLAHQIKLMSLEAAQAQSNPTSLGIKGSSKYLVKAIKRRITKQ